MRSSLGMEISSNVRLPPRVIGGYWRERAEWLPASFGPLPSLKMTLSMGRTRAKVGDVVQVVLPDGTHAYGRVLRQASVAFSRARTVEPRSPPIGSRDY